MRLAALGLCLALAPEPDAAPRGYWLGVELAEADGPAADAALNVLREARDDFTPSGDPPPGVVVGHASRVEDALAWVARWSFHAGAPGTGGGKQPRGGDAPPPGGALLTRHGVHLRSLVVSGSTPDGGTRRISWPADAGAMLPDELGWRAATLLPRRAPLFAAPSPTVPPAAERHAEAQRSGGLYVLDHVDRCNDGPKRVCLRWARVVSRVGDRFTPGYLPAFQVAVSDAWTPRRDVLPRAQAIPSAITGTDAHFELIARASDNAARRRTVTAPASDDTFPVPLVQVAGDVAIVTFPGTAPLRLRLDAALDPRPPSPAD